MISAHVLNLTGRRRAPPPKQSDSANAPSNISKSSTRSRAPSRRSQPFRMNGPPISTACRTIRFSPPPTWSRHRRTRPSSSSAFISRKGRRNSRKPAAAKFSSPSHGKRKAFLLGPSTTSVSRLTAVSAYPAHPFWPDRSFSLSNGGFAVFSYGIFHWRIILQETPRPPAGARIS